MENVIDNIASVYGFNTNRLTREQKSSIKAVLGISDLKQLKQYDEFYDSVLEMDIENEQDNTMIEALVEHVTTLRKTGMTKKEMIREYVDSQCNFSGDYESEHMRYFPDEYNKLVPKQGAWVMVAQKIPTEVKPVVYSVYYAKPANVTRTISIGRQSINTPYHKVKISTEQGEVHLWPHEYIKIPYEFLLEEAGNSFDKVELGGTPSYDSTKIHFLKMRGLKQSDIYKIMLASINSIDYVYFRVKECAVEFYEFFIDALSKGIRPEMALHIWDCKINNKPIFNVVYNDNTNTKRDGKE